MLMSIDLETTGLNPRDHQILEIAAVVLVDKENPYYADSYWKFHRTIRHKQIYGDPVAIVMNTDLIKRSTELYYCDEVEAMEQFDDWCKEVYEGFYDEKITPVGFNVGSFDMQFLKETGELDLSRFSHRSLEVGSMYATIDGPAKSADFEHLAQKYSVEGKPYEALYDAWVAMFAAMEKLSPNIPFGG